MLKTRFSPRFTSDALWSLSGNGASVLAGLATVKVITTWVPPEAYGHASLLLGIVAALNGMMVGPVMVAHLRFYFDYQNREAGRWYVAMFRVIFLGLGGAASLAYLVFALFNSLGGDRIFLGHFPAVCVILFSQPFFSGRTNYLEAHRQQKQLAFMNILHRSGQPLVLFALLAVACPAIDALLLAQGLTILILLWTSRAPQASPHPGSSLLQKNLEFWPLLREITTFGWTLPMTFLVMWLLTTSDRYLLQHFMTPADVGRYAMNYGFWSMPFIFLNGWLEVLTRPLIYDAAAKNDWARVMKMLVWRLGFGALASAAGIVLLLWLARPIAAAMLNDQYWIGIRFVAVIAGAHCFYVLGYAIVPIFIAAKKMNAVFIATACAAAANILINWFSIPVSGLLGAAFATLCGYVLWAAILAGAAVMLVGNRLASARERNENSEEACCIE